MDFYETELDDTAKNIEQSLQALPSLHINGKAVFSVYNWTWTCYSRSPNNIDFNFLIKRVCVKSACHDACILLNQTYIHECLSICRNSPSNNLEQLRHLVLIHTANELSKAVPSDGVLSGGSFQSINVTVPELNPRKEIFLSHLGESSHRNIKHFHDKRQIRPEISDNC